MEKIAVDVRRGVVGKRAVGRMNSRDTKHAMGGIAEPKKG